MVKQKAQPQKQCKSDCKEAVEIQDNFYCKLKTQDVKFPKESGKLTECNCIYYKK